MDTYLTQVRDLRLQAAERMKAVTAKAAEEKRELSAEENSDFDAAEAAYDKYAAEEKRHLGAQEKLAASDAMREQIERATVEDRKLSPTEETDAQRLDKLFRGEIKGFESARSIPVGAGWSSRALSSPGGSAIPTTFADFVTVYERTANPLLGISTVIATRTGAPIVLPRLTADVTAGGSVTAEAGTITEGDPTISSITLTAFKIAHITLYSSELDQDEVIGLDELLANAIARPISLGWGTFFTTGTGTTQPQGFIGAATNGGTAAGTTGNQASDTFFAASDLVDLYYSLAAPYRANASWVVSNTAIAKMRKFRDANGQFLWGPALQVGAPDTFLNRPVYENPAMAAVASASKSVAVGDFSKYVIRDVQPMRVDVSDQYKFNSDQLALRVVTRRDGNLPDAIAIKYLVSADT